MQTSLPLPHNIVLCSDAVQNGAFDAFLTLVCPMLNVSQCRIMAARTRCSDLIHARHCLIYLARTQLNLSLNQTARLFDRDRSTIRACCSKIENMRDTLSFDIWLSDIETLFLKETSL